MIKLKMSPALRKLGMLAVLVACGTAGLKAFHELTIVKQGVSWYMFLTYRPDVHDQIQSQIMQRLYPLTLYAFLCGVLLAAFLFLVITDLKKTLQAPMAKKLGMLAVLMGFVVVGCFLGFKAFQGLTIVRQSALPLENYGDIEFHILQRLYPLVIYASICGALLGIFLGAFKKLSLTV